MRSLTITLLLCTLCQSCGQAVRAAHLCVLLTGPSQLLHSTVKLVLYCLPLRRQHAQSYKAAIMILSRSTAILYTLHIA